MKALTDADCYRVEKESQANLMKLTPEYLELKRIEALSSTSKVYYGPNIPQMFMDTFTSQSSVTTQHKTDADSSNRDSAAANNGSPVTSSRGRN